MSILLNVCCHNRLDITRLALHSLVTGRGKHDVVQVYNDHSTQYGNEALVDFCDDIVQLDKKLGIHALRHYQMERFLDSPHDQLYLTDNDAIHDPTYRSVLRQMYKRYQKPVSLYNSVFHALPALQLAEYPDAYLRKIVPGISVLLDKHMVEAILRHVGSRFTYSWDYEISEGWESGMITTKTSYVEHYGKDGLHNQDYERDRALNPTAELAKYRSVVIKVLEKDILRERDNYPPQE